MFQKIVTPSKQFLEYKYSFTIVQKCIFRQKSTKIREEQINLFADILDISFFEAKSYIMSNKYLATLDSNDLHSMQNVLHKFHIKKGDIIEHPEIWKTLPVVIENRGMLLEECGIKKLNIGILLRYLQIMRKKISLLHIHDIIPSDLNIQQSLYSYLEPPPSNVVPLQPIENSSLYEIYMGVLQHFLQWKLEVTNEQYQYILKTYTRIKHKSLRNIKRTLDLLQNELNFSIERIRKHGYLIHSNPDNITKILNEINTLGGEDVRIALHKHPKIIMTNSDTLKKTLDILKEHNVSDDAVVRCMDIFTLSANSVLKRLLELKKVPEFEALANNPRAMKLVHYQHKAKSRLLYLQQLKIKNASLHILCSPDERFEKFVREGADKTRGDDLAYMLEEELYKPAEEIRQRLNLHPFWYHVSIVTAKETLQFLYKEGFRSEDILKCIHIVLYPKEKVKLELSRLRSRPELVRKWLNSVQKLNLCMYYIEQPHHFSGDGIWNNTETLIESPNT